MKGKLYDHCMHCDYGGTGCKQKQHWYPCGFEGCKDGNNFIMGELIDE